MEDGKIVSKGRIDPDFWCFVQGKMKVGIGESGYEGQFGDESVSGGAHFDWREAPAKPRGDRASTGYTR